MVRQGYVRPLLLLVVGWYMGTRRMIQKHAEDPRSPLLLLHPAYCFFYTMFVGAGMVLVYQEWDRREGEPDPASKCSDYFNDTYDRFGFLVDSFDREDGGTIFRANNFFFKMLAVLAAQTAVAFGFAWHLRRRSGRLTSQKVFRERVFVYAVTALAVGVGVFILVTLAAPGGDDDPSAAGQVPCAFDPMTLAPAG